VAAPFLASIVKSIENVNRVFVTAIDDFLLTPSDAQRAAAFVNAHTNPDDLVIASPGIAWMLEAQAADYQMAVAATGRATPHLPADLPPDRFAFDPRYTRAQFVVVDNLWRSWAVIHVPTVTEMMREVEAWPLAFQSGEIAVYAAP
jgi:hypothetical protein